MTHEFNRIEIDLVPLTSFPSAYGKAGPWLAGYPLQIPLDGSSSPNTAFGAHLMMFSVMRGETTTPVWGRALHAGRSAFTLYLTGTPIGLWCCSLGLVRLVEDFEEFCPSGSSMNMN
ncbi:hypothetical protein GFL15_19785 [Rhizobium leguminosarum bv. viciae]|nr:hypothetical protein [Rhizobium leguminosarum bv. viciae]